MKVVDTSPGENTHFSHPNFGQSQKAENCANKIHSLKLTLSMFSGLWFDWSVEAGACAVRPNLSMVPNSNWQVGEGNVDSCASKELPFKNIYLIASRASSGSHLLYSGQRIWEETLKCHILLEVRF